MAPCCAAAAAGAVECLFSGSPMKIYLNSGSLACCSSIPGLLLLPWISRVGRVLLFLLSEFGEKIEVWF